MSDEDSTHALLLQARQQARRLASRLEEELADFVARARPEQLEQGRELLNKALASARRTLQSLDDALGIAGSPPEQTGPNRGRHEQP